MSQGITYPEAMQARIAELEARLAKFEREDDGEPVTEARVSCIAIEYHRALHQYRLTTDLCYWPGNKDGEFVWSRVTGSVVPLAHQPTTMSQVRRLIAALKGEP